MTHSIARTAAIALGMAALVSLSPLSARADTPTAPAPNPAPASNATAPSLAEPAPTPGWAESELGGRTVAQRHAMRHYPHHYARHYTWRNGHRYSSDNPVASAATGVAGGIADLGSIAAYPFYCFPDYGSCPVRVPYR